MNDLRVDFGGLATASADIASSAGAVESLLDDLERSLQPLRSGWSGEASEAYEQARVQWSAALTDMKELLARIGAAVSTSGEEYLRVERANAARW